MSIVAWRFSRLSWICLLRVWISCIGPSDFHFLRNTKFKKKIKWIGKSSFKLWQFSALECWKDSTIISRIIMSCDDLNLLKIDWKFHRDAPRKKTLQCAYYPDAKETVELRIWTYFTIHSWFINLKFFYIQ